MSSKEDASDKGYPEDHDRKVKRSKTSNDDDDDDVTMASSGSSLDEDESTAVVPPHQELVFLDYGKPVYANDIPALQGKTMGDDIQDVAICDKYIAVLRTSGCIQLVSLDTRFGLPRREFAKTTTVVGPHPDASTKFVKIAAQSNDSDSLFAALSEDGKVYAFFRKGDFIVDSKVVMENVADIAAGEHFSLYLTQDGTVFKQGEYDEHASDPFDLSFAAVSFPKGTSIKQMSAGPYHAAFVTEEGQLFTAGLSRKGRLGVPEQRGDGEFCIKEPQLVAAGVKSVSCGGDHTVALLENGTVLCFGGGGGRHQTAVSGLDGLSVDQIASSKSKSLLLADSSLYAIPFPYHSEKPQKVTNLDGVKVHSIAAVHERLQAVFVQRTSLPPIDWVRDMLYDNTFGEHKSVDTTFVLKGQEKLYGSKDFITRRCKALLGANPDQNPVNVPESLGKEAFKRVLRFVLTDKYKVPITLKEALGDWQVAHQYGIREVVCAFHEYATKRLHANTPGKLVKRILDRARERAWPMYEGSVKWTHFGGEASDSPTVKVMVVDGDEISLVRDVHKGVWAHHSSYELDETADSIEICDTSTKTIRDTSAKTFKVANRFMYSSDGKIEDSLNFKESIAVYKFAERYGFESLKTAIYPHLQESMEVGDIPELFVLSITRDDLKEIFWFFAANNTDALLEDKEAMAAVTSTPNMNLGIAVMSNLNMFLEIAAKKFSCI